MFFRKILVKIHPKKKRTWIWIVGIFAAIFALIFLSIRIAIGELGELGIRKITGFPLAQNYLVVFQNDAERRPTGGFITAFATLKFRAGIPFFEFGNVYSEKLIQKNSAPPDPLVAQLLAGDFYPGHGFRDGNLDADFPTSAEELIRLFRLGFPGSDFDGVIAVDFTAFENLAKKLSPEISGDAGLFAALENQIQNVDLHDPDELKNRKNFLGDVAKNLIKKSIFHPKIASEIFVENLRSKHLLFYFRDPEIQKVVAEKNWGGILPVPENSDLLAVVEGNFGGMKSSRYLLRDIFYDVEFTENSENELSATANLRIALAHRGDAAEPISGFYKSIWRIFTPPASAGAGSASSRIFTKIVEMNPGESREINLKYSLPPEILAAGKYNLRLQKQPGSADDHIRITVKMPAGYLLASDDFDARENLAIFETNLDSDQNLSLRILPDTIPPRLAWQNFTGKNFRTIDLRFNEPLDPDSVAIAAFALRDLDFRNSRTDDIRIEKIEFVPPQNIELQISGATAECREWFELRFDGVADRHGNILRDQKVTVVQWVDSAGQNCDPNREL